MGEWLVERHCGEGKLAVNGLRRETGGEGGAAKGGNPNVPDPSLYSYRSIRKAMIALGGNFKKLNKHLEEKKNINLLCRYSEYRGFKGEVSYPSWDCSFLNICS